MTKKNKRATTQQQSAPPSSTASEKNHVNNNNNPQNNDNESNNISLLFVELDSEIERMSADNDAILESIRLAATTPESSSSATSNSRAAARPKLTLSNLLEGQKQDALNRERKNNNTADYDYHGDDTDDDDMTDDGGSVTSLLAELQEVEKSFSAAPSRPRAAAAAAEKKTTETVPIMPTTISTAVAIRPALPVASTAVNEKKKKNDDVFYTSWLSSPKVWIDHVLFLMIIFTWALIAITMYSIVQNDYMILNDKGEIAVFPLLAEQQDIPDESVPSLSEQP